MKLYGLFSYRRPLIPGIYCLLLTCSFTFRGFGTQVSGKVTDNQDNALPYANVYLKGTSTGTTTNADGFYKLDVPSGSHVMVFRYLGYKLKTENIIAGDSPLVVNVSLEPEQYHLHEVSVTAGDEDPANTIMRKAIGMRKFYLNQVSEFSCNVYIKGLQKITKHPKKLFGIEIDLGDILDTTTGIVYLSESVSKYSFRKPDQVNEVMISSKVSGSNRAFSFNKASDMEFNFYENIMEVEGLSQRGFISPVSGSAMFYYRFKLEGSVYENGRWVYKISVIPKRKNDPVFSGTIFIQDSTWRIYGTDLMLTKDAQIEFVDTLRVNQVFIPATADESVWLPGSNTFYFAFSAFGFEGEGNFVGVFSEYEVETGKNKRKYSSAVMKINDDANKRDSVYWEKIRPVPLTLEEFNDYQKRDSLMVIRDSKTYLDSLDRKSNKFKFNNIFTGYTFTSRYHKAVWSVSSLLENVQFNTVEGLNIGLDMDHSKRFEDQRMISTSINGRYGFSNEKWNGVVGFMYRYNPKKFGSVTAAAGDDLIGINGNNAVTPIINTGYSLFSEKNYLKLYHKRFARIAVKHELFNGFTVEPVVEYSLRDAVVNTTDYSFRNSESTRYTSNNPLNPESDLKMFPENTALSFDITTRIRIRQKYIDRPFRKVILGSKYPEIFTGYRMALEDGFDDYGRFRIGIEDDYRLGMIGALNAKIIYDRFIFGSDICFIDYLHFRGNQTAISGFLSDRFELLDYYKYSTADQSLQVFVNHEFGGFIMNKIPLLRKLKLQETGGFRYLYVPDRIQHFEFSFGLAKLNLVRADVVIGFDDKGNINTGWVLGVVGLGTGD